MEGVGHAGRVRVKDVPSFCVDLDLSNPAGVEKHPPDLHRT